MWAQIKISVEQLEGDEHITTATMTNRFPIDKLDKVIEPIVKQVMPWAMPLFDGDMTITVLKFEFRRFPGSQHVNDLELTLHRILNPDIRPTENTKEALEAVIKRQYDLLTDYVINLVRSDLLEDVMESMPLHQVSTKGNNN